MTVWISRNYARCSGCRRCEIVCSISHEGKIWPEASRVRVFMLFPGIEVPHMCFQCYDHPCVEACPVSALSINMETGAVLVEKDKCTACGNCVEVCPGKVPFIHPVDNYAVICDLCDGKPKCVEVCTQGGWNCLQVIDADEVGSYTRKLYVKKPEEIAKKLAIQLYGEKGYEVV